MRAQPESDEALVKRLLPSANPDPEDRARAWAEWHRRWGGEAVLKYVRLANNTPESDEDILQDAMLTAYVEVERGHYEHRAGIPFTAIWAEPHLRLTRHTRRAHGPGRGDATTTELPEIPKINAA
jgi:hypothetical protein